MGALFLVFGGQLLKSFSGFALIAIAILGILIAVHRWHKNNDVHTVQVTIESVESGNVCHAHSHQGLRQRRHRAGREVRLIDIAVPEATDAIGTQSRNRVAGLIDGQMVDVEVVGRTRLVGPIVGVVYTKERWCLNELLVSEGLAWCTSKDRSEWMVEEKKAQAKQLGVWADFKQSDDRDVYLAESFAPAETPVTSQWDVPDVLTPFLDFAIGSWQWCVIFAAAVLLAAMALNYHNVTAAAVVLIVSLSAMMLAGDLTEYLAVFLHPVVLAIGVGVYLLGAIIYGGLRWFLYVRSRLIAYNAFKAGWFRSNNLAYSGINSDIPDNMKTSWSDYVSRSQWVTTQTTGAWTLAVVPDPWTSRDRLQEWMAFWPVSLAAFVFSGLFELCWEGLFREFSALLAAISAKIGSVSSNDTPVVPPAA